jgi:cytochrome c553
MVKLGFGFISVGLLTLALGQSETPAPKPAASSWPSYSKDVAPILKASCVSCHAANGSAGLNLASAAGIAKTKSIIKGDPVKSDLIRRIKGLDGKPQMPMGFKPLSPAQVKILEDWISGGAKVDTAQATHWAYVAPKEPFIPELKSTWIKNPIDSFVLEKMKQQGYSPSPIASKEAVARRVFLDLIGLPPSLEELDSYLNDTRSDAYERMVDGLLASPQYGERQARIWLDLARYADSNGYEKDRNRVAWPYRDWVINAYNRNLPFDQFTIEQLAGDMLPSPSQEQVIATGFHRNTMFNEEDGVEPGEAFYNVVTDRVATTSTVWMGSTLQCARCHDHKFDPFSQKDFFRVYAIFGNAKYEKRGDYVKTEAERWYEPSVAVETAQVRSQREQLKKQLFMLEQKRTKFAANNPEGRAKWDAEVGNRISWLPLEAESLMTEHGTQLKQSRDFSISASGPNPNQEAYVIEANVPDGHLTAVRLEAISEGTLGAGRTSGGNFVLTDFQVQLDGQQIRPSYAGSDFEQSGFRVLDLLEGKKNSGWAVYPESRKDHFAIFDFGEKRQAKRIRLTLRFDSTHTGHNLRKFILSASSAPYPMLEFHPKPPLSEEDWIVTDPYFFSMNRQIEQARRKLADLEVSRPMAQVLGESAAIKLAATLYHRGEFSSPKEKVDAGVPTVLPPIKENANRLSFAKWLVSPENPLTARVQVNRIWEQYFGRGLVDTPEDFGTQGARPSHQKLLDWLATSYIKSGWDTKRLHRLIVTSAVYQQSSKASEALLKRDPYNIYLARGPRFRMEAEMIRDVALRTSGLLSLKLGGPSVMPYQPNGVWDSPYNGENWNQARDEDQYRRGLYVFAKRTSMYPSFMAFDATSRESCTVRRGRTNTPLQALALLNDQAYLEAARALGIKMAEAADGAVTGFRLATGRTPSPSELAILNKSLAQFRKRFADRPEDAKKLGGNPDQAAWTMLGNVLLNLDETITKG